jgi:hypothetical protein
MKVTFTELTDPTKLLFEREVEVLPRLKEIVAWIQNPTLGGTYEVVGVTHIYRVDPSTNDAWVILKRIDSTGTIAFGGTSGPETR